MKGKEKIFVTRKIPKKGLDLLDGDFELIIRQEETIPTVKEIRAGLEGCTGLICLLTDNINREVLSVPGLIGVSNYAAGYNNIDVDYATSQGIPVTNSPGALTETTADLAFALLLASARRIPEAHEYAKSGKFTGWGAELFLGADVHGKTLGIIGAGKIGGSLARRALGFNMTILYHNRKPDKLLESDTGAQYCSLDELLTESDFISLHTPLSQETHHLITKREFRLMKKTAIFINTARGACVNEKDLADALKNGEIWGAGMDVFEEEPIINPKLLELNNVVVLPHIGSASLITRRGMAVTTCRNMEKILKGEMPPNIVNPEVYDS